MNLVPSQYRNVSVADVPVALDEDSLREFLVGRPVYRRTRYIVARHGGASAVVEVSEESELPLFSPVVSMSVLDPTATMRSPRTATACAMGGDLSTVQTLALVMMRSASGRD